MKGKFSINWIAVLLATVILAVLCVIFFRENIPVFGTVIPKDKEVLVRYYACSLALCTNGCGSEMVKNLCLYNDSVTHECTGAPNTGYKWCQDFCVNPPPDWPHDSDGNPIIPPDGPNITCGKTYPLSLPLGEVYLKGNYRAQQIGARESAVLHYYTETNDIINTLNNRGNFPTPSDIIPDVCRNKLHNYFYPGLIWTIDKELVIGISFGTTNTEGVGWILLDPIQAIEKYGCYYYSIPVEGGWPMSTGYGFYRCKFHGDLKIWSIWRNDGCADAFFNSSIGSPPKFTLDVHNSADMKECNDRPGDKKCQVIYNGSTAKFDADITNELGTGSSFTLSIDYYIHDGVTNTKESNDGSLGCVLPCEGNFNPNGGDFIVPDFGKTGNSTLSLTPTALGEYEIYVRADKPDKYDSQLDKITLKVVDFNVYFLPKELDVVEDYVAKDEKGSFTVEIHNQIDESKDFTLSYTCDDGSDGTCDCVDADDESIDGKVLTVDGDDYGDLEIKCSSSDPGDYTIRVSATTDDKTKWTKNSAMLHVLECYGDISLSFSENSVDSGKSLKITADGLSGCDGEPIDFYVNYEDELSIGSCSIGEGKTGCSLDRTTNSLGTYTIYARINKNPCNTDPCPSGLDKDYDDDGERTSASLTINEHSRKKRTVVENTEGTIWHCCAGCFDNINVAHMCQRCCGTFGWSVCNAQDCCDPQSCGVPAAMGLAASASSSICCVSGKDEHSSGPGNVPCLSTDTRNDHKLTIDFYYSGYVQNPKNFYDSLSYMDSDHVVHDFYTYFEHQAPGSKDDCYGGASAPQPLQDLKKYVNWVDSPWGKNCKFNGSSEEDYVVYYGKSWIFLRITPSGESRPVYGIASSFYTYTGNFINVLLHKKTGEWIHIGSISDATGGEIIRPSGKWAWDDIDSILLGFGQGSGVGYLYHLELLTKGGNDIPFCTEGNDNQYYRTVDDGKKCYWGVDCPTSGTGWTGKESYSVGPFLEYGCDCSSGTCGNGYCKTGNFCYSDVKCINGGWNGTLTKCTGTCTSTGCA